MRLAALISIVGVLGLSLMANGCNPYEAVRSPSRTLLEATTLRLFYLSIGIETVEPVTSETIERGTACIVSQPHEVGLIKGLLASATPVKSWGRDFGYSVRVKIYERTAGGESLSFIVQNHGATRDTSGDAQLSPQALSNLKMVIEAVCK
jgi:hypothetical protein